VAIVCHRPIRVYFEIHAAPLEWTSKSYICCSCAALSLTL
jgi:hypothetical protein